VAFSASTQASRVQSEIGPYVDLSLTGRWKNGREASLWASFDRRLQLRLDCMSATTTSGVHIAVLVDQWR
jgi:hypothetical protein